LKFCRECRNAIENEKMGAVVYSRNGKFPHKIVHKGKCHDKTRQRIENDGQHTIWRELSLYNNIGLTVIS